MKIRQGFVSNSSSASFVVTAKISKEAFMKLFLEEYGSYPNIYYSFEGTPINEHIKELEERISKYDTSGERKVEVFLKEQSENYLKELKELKEKLDGPDKIVGIEAYLTMRDIYVSEELAGIVRIDGDTSMFNDMRNVPKIMKEMIFLLAINKIELSFNITDRG